LDISTILGAVGGVALLLGGIFLGGGTPLRFFSASSIFIVLGGSVASALIAFPMDKVIASFGLMWRVARAEETDPAPLVPLLISLARKARREGLLALEHEIAVLPSDFLRRGLRLVVDGSDPQVMRDVLENDIRIMQDRHATGRAVLQYLGREAPAFGLVGTVVGLVIMLYKLQGNPEGIGQGLAVALLTTFYGLIFAHLWFVPMAAKLELRSEREVLSRYMMLEGIMSVQSGENPVVLEERLSVFLSPDRRTSVPGPASGESPAP